MEEVIETLGPRSDVTCYFCESAKGIYSCPRCGLNYCSLKCYRCDGHTKCSEEFYKDQVISHLQVSNVDDEIRNQVVELLVAGNFGGNKKSRKRIKRTYGDEDFALTEEEWAKFDNLVNTGGIYNLLPSSFWDPWYVKLPERKVSESCDYDDSSDEFPPYPTELPSLKTLTKGPVSPMLKSSVIQCIFSYCCLCRYFSGDLLSDPEETFSFFLSVSFLDKKQTMQPTTELCLQLTCRKLIEEYKMNTIFLKKTLDDLLFILRRGNYIILRCLVDICSVCRQARRKTKDKSLKGIEKKLCFLMSWCAEGEEVIQQEIPKIEIESLSMAMANLPGKSNTNFESTSKTANQ